MPTMRRHTMAALLLTLATALAGCASVAGTASQPTPTPTCYVPLGEDSGATLSPDCVAYDPQAGMDLNDAHKERLQPAPGDAEAGADLVSAAQAELAALGADADANDVRAALVSAGVEESGIQIIEETGRIRFGATYSGGGDLVAECLYGEVSGASVTVETGGLVADGGCLAMDGH